MAPQRNKKPASDDNDNSEKDDPQWDANERNLLLYLLTLKRWLPNQHPQFKNFIRHGYIRSSASRARVGRLWSWAAPLAYAQAGVPLNPQTGGNIECCENLCSQFSMVLGRGRAHTRLDRPAHP